MWGLFFLEGLSSLLWFAKSKFPTLKDPWLDGTLKDALAVQFAETLIAPGDVNPSLAFFYCQPDFVKWLFDILPDGVSLKLLPDGVSLKLLPDGVSPKLLPEFVGLKLWPLLILLMTLNFLHVLTSLSSFNYWSRVSELPSFVKVIFFLIDIVFLIYLN